MNMMTGHAWVGVYLNSGSYTHALKQLALEEFWRFKVEFPTYQLADGSGTLKDKMYGSNDQAKLRAAWNAYASFKLRHLERPWKRVYVKIPEGALLLQLAARGTKERARLG
jgi:1,2-phenylacetyl-CoA epoxidase catalytic subunit